MILIIDDDSAIRSSLSFLLKRKGYSVEAVAGPQEALDFVRHTAPRLILMDMNFTLSTSGEEGLTLLRQVKIFQPHTPVILITAWGSIDLAVEGMKCGAADFITKPWDNLLLMQRIETILQISGDGSASGGGGTSVAGDGADGFDRGKIIGKSRQLEEVLATVRRIAATNASVLITGESGTGKELIAEAIHNNSRRKGNPFVKVNLGGISHSLFESEMFGHRKGAFTDAYSDREGRFSMADKGTIFLDEIGDLDLSCQVKLLRVLQEQTFEPLGESRPRKVDVRVVCATNANLQQMVQQKLFREDLLYRINLITIHLPALRERTGDIPLLAEHFAAQTCMENSLPDVSLSEDSMEYLSSLPFPGNVRELKNLVERTVLISDKDELGAGDFKAQYSGAAGCSGVSLQGMSLEELEKASIIENLKKYGNNISQTAEALKISRAALYRRIEKYNINVGE